MKKNIAIAIDGPAGAGKSTIAKLVADKLNFVYVDTGAMYRAIAWKVLKDNINYENEDDVTKVAHSLNIDFRYLNDELHIFANNIDVSDAIRTPEVSHIVSNIAKICSVRKHLVTIQRDLAKKSSVVMDGRDIASNVLPNADVKIFLTASVDERAKRRYKELSKRGFKVNFEDLKNELILRDKTDMERKVSPLIKTDDAILLDTTDISIDDAVKFIMDQTEKVI